MAKSRPVRGRAASARSVSRTHPARRDGGVRTVRGGAGPREREPGPPAGLRAGATPARLLEALAADEDPAGLLAVFDAAGLRPSAEEVLGEVLAGWAPLLRPRCDPLDAEVAGAEFLGLMRRLIPEDADLAEIVTTMIAQAEGSGTAEAMAMASVLAVLGPEEVRSAASHAAARLAAAGVAAPSWAAGLGRPAVGKCFGYGDAFGEQETIALCFSYGRKRHAVGVLIDHVLGGGVKDCFVSGQPDQVRAYFRLAAQQNGLSFENYTAPDAASILARALAREPCPEQLDQVEDVADHLDLLRSRLELFSQTGIAT